MKLNLKFKIKIITELIPFNYFHKFNQVGNYKIKYLFYEKINKTDFMICDCCSLTNINLPNFNTQNDTNTSRMFLLSNSLKNSKCCKYE